MAKKYDRLNRPLTDLRISVTDRCNLRCAYCMPADSNPCFLSKEKLLSVREIERAVSAMYAFEIEKVRITGGEPCLRTDLPDIIKVIRNIGIQDIALTTNGILLEDKLPRLKAAGLRRLNISLDALDDALFQKITGMNISNQVVLSSIFAAERLGFEVKINMVVIRGQNEREILPMVEFFKEKGIQLRFIEYMDAGCMNDWKMEKVVSKKEIYDFISRFYDLQPVTQKTYGEVAKRYMYTDNGSQVGFISSVTEAFCPSCTRARLSSNGIFYNCLFAESGLDISKVLKYGSIQEIRDQISAYWTQRADRYSEERNPLVSRKKIEMSYIGG